MDRSQYSIPLEYRFLREIRLRNVRGWYKLCEAIASPSKQKHHDYVIGYEGFSIVASPSSYVEWNHLLFHGYEEPLKKIFVSEIPGNRRSTLLDIGANIGSHSLFFSRIFDDVFAFEPNKVVAERLRRNLKLNTIQNVHVQEIGLGEVNEKVKFFAPDPSHETNFGTGSFISEFSPSKHISDYANVVRGDDFIKDLGIDKVDAVKIDVQGYEVRVLKGLSETLVRDKPYIWFEVSAETIREIETAGGINSLFPFKYRLFGFVLSYQLFFFHKWILEEITETNVLVPGNYLIRPI